MENRHELKNAIMGFKVDPAAVLAIEWGLARPNDLERQALLSNKKITISAKQVKVDIKIGDMPSDKILDLVVRGLKSVLGVTLKKMDDKRFNDMIHQKEIPWNELWSGDKSSPMESVRRQTTLATVKTTIEAMKGASISKDVIIKVCVGSLDMFENPKEIVEKLMEGMI